MSVIPVPPHVGSSTGPPHVGYYTPSHAGVLLRQPLLAPPLSRLAMTTEANKKVRFIHDPMSLYYIHPAESAGNSLTKHLLKGDNYDKKGQTMVVYYNQFVTLWNKMYGSTEPTCGCRCEAAVRIRAREEEEKTHHFLLGLDDEQFGHIWSQLIATKAVPDIHQAYVLIVQEERHKIIVRGRDYRTDVVAFAMQHPSTPPAHGDPPIYSCTHCGKDEHSKERCFQLHGYPPAKGRGRGGVSGRGSGSGRGFGRGSSGGSSSAGRGAGPATGGAHAVGGGRDCATKMEIGWGSAHNGVFLFHASSLGFASQRDPILLHKRLDHPSSQVLSSLIRVPKMGVSNGVSLPTEGPQTLLGYHFEVNSNTQEETDSDGSMRDVIGNETTICEDNISSWCDLSKESLFVTYHVDEISTHNDHDGELVSWNSIDSNLSAYVMSQQDIDSLKEMHVTSRFDPTRIVVSAIYASKMDLDFHLKMLVISDCFQYQTRTSKKSELHVVCVDFPCCQWAVRAVCLPGIEMF
ncbi:unnamed protein product [Cuscuta campestris]|uniref:Transposase MuDR plant domain-containing protein n=1 Tax=Cuscuta campestris TaxID=132261 RepID=A0A484MQC7_9ASTE|nr:unnamed protein product [Cuscuta campestris]